MATSGLNAQIKRLQSTLGVRHVSPELIWLYGQKYFYQKLRLQTPTEHRILAIFGCQRSGTSLLTRVFFRDFDVKVYRETSRLSSDDQENAGRKLRINEFSAIRKVIDQETARLVVLKPLVESQRATEFLDFFPAMKGMWLYRHYRDVAASNLQAFGMENGIEDLRPMVTGDPNNWRSEGLSAELQTLVQRHFAEDMNPYDAAALFWYVRNRLFFELQLAQDPRVMLCRYEHWVTDPGPMTAQMYEFVQLPYPGDHIIKEVHAASVKRGQDVPLSPTIEALCRELLTELNRCDTATQTPRSVPCRATRNATPKLPTCFSASSTVST